MPRITEKQLLTRIERLQEQHSFPVRLERYRPDRTTWFTVIAIKPGTNERDFTLEQGLTRSECWHFLGGLYASLDLQRHRAKLVAEQASKS